MSEYLALVACGAPLAARVHEIAETAQSHGWIVRVVATASAMRWIDADEVRKTTNHPPLVEQRLPGEPKRFPTPGRVIVCPATFNSINKLAVGIMDNYAAGLVCEALSSGTPLSIVPSVSDALRGHPAWKSHLAMLEAAGVTFHATEETLFTTGTAARTG